MSEKTTPNSFSKGMITDVDPAYQSKESYYHGINVRVITNGDKSFSIENLEGPKMVDDPGNTGDNSSSYVTHGAAIVEDYLVTITKQNDGDPIWKINKYDIDELTADIGNKTQLWSGEDLFDDGAGKIEIEVIVETETIHRIYCTDGKSGLKSINIKDSYLSTKSASELTAFRPNLMKPIVLEQYNETGGNLTYGSYAYVTLNDIVNNFIVGYVGEQKLIPNVRRSDIIFHAKRGLQEFSYDTLKSVKSQELTVPHTLSNILPQDYVNYVRVSRIDSLGVKRIIYPANNLTISPYENPLQDNLGQPTQDNFEDNLEATSLTEKNWKGANTNLINGIPNLALYNEGMDWAGYNWGYGGFWYWGWGEQYGMSPEYAQYNGWFNMNPREGKISFSSNLMGALIVLEYISDGLAYDLDSRIPKMAEAALYAYISHAIIASRINQPEYIVQRLKREASAKLRNAKIRLSNIKLDEIVQVMRGKSKWIKR